MSKETHSYLLISVRLPKIPGPRRAQRGPRPPTNCHNQRFHGGWTDVQKKKYCMPTCHRLSKSLTSAHYERRRAVTNTAESSPAAFSLLPYKKIKMAAPWKHRPCKSGRVPRKYVCMPRFSGQASGTLQPASDPQWADEAKPPLIFNTGPVNVKEELAAMFVLNKL